MPPRQRAQRSGAVRPASLIHPRSFAPLSAPPDAPSFDKQADVRFDELILNAVLFVLLGLQIVLLKRSGGILWAGLAIIAVRPALHRRAAAGDDKGKIGAPKRPREDTTAMSTLRFIGLLLLAATAAFTALNWGAFTAPTSLSLAFTTVHGPLGLITLAAAALLLAVLLAYTVYLQTTAILAGRRHARELEAQRQLAEQSEASRFTELRALLESRSDQLRAELAACEGRIQSRSDELAKELRSVVEHTGNTIAAYIGEAEDRLERAIGPTGTR